MKNIGLFSRQNTGVVVRRVFLAFPFTRLAADSAIGRRDRLEILSDYLILTAYLEFT